MKDPEFQDNPIKPDPNVGGLHKPLADFDTLEHINDIGHPDVHKIYKEFRQLLDDYSVGQPRMAIGEIHEPNTQRWVTYYGEQLDELHMPFNFGLLWTDWSGTAIRQHVETIEAALPDGAWPNYVLGNHDEIRITSRLGKAQARIAAMLLLTLRGTPTLYNGDEIGMPNVPIPPDKQQDPWGINVPGYGLDRDPVRTPMQWGSSLNAGFSKAEVETWLPVADDYKENNVDEQLKDPGSLLSLYRQLLRIRKNSSALQVGKYESFDGVPDDCFVYKRYYEHQSFVIALNLSDKPHSLSLPIQGQAEIIFSTQFDNSGQIDLTDFDLRPDEGLLIALK